jgi:P27 family predicted phage terminase small subunit
MASPVRTHARFRCCINFNLQHAAMRGRKPKPTALREMEGNPGKRPLNRREPKPKGDLYAAPEWMSATQREGWAYAVTHAPYGLLKQLDRSVLAIWVVAEDLHREAAEKITQYDLLTKSPNAGLPLQSPYLAILNKQAQIMLKAGAELGFSPSSRTRVQLEVGLSGPLSWLRDRDNDPDGLLAKPWNSGRTHGSDEVDEFFGD